MTPYTKWKWLVPVDFLAGFIGRVLAPFVVLFATKYDHLPKWLSWFDTPDNPLMGDLGWQTKHMQWRFKFSPKIAQYIGRVGWLWRNNMYGFKIDVLGAKVLATDTLVTSGDPLTQDRPNAHSGTYKRELYREGNLIYFQEYTIKVYPWWPSRCYRKNKGWKLWDFKGEARNIQYTNYTHPLKGTSA